MFEKEAEEWVIDSVCKDCSRYEKCKNKEHCTCKDCSKEKWQDGAEFGYNKANEWHYVKDGDLPKGNDAVLIYWKFGDKKCASVVEPYKVTGDKYIIAWKEIMLPELKEVSE